jgi:hypothetical protein
MHFGHDPNRIHDAFHDAEARHRGITDDRRVFRALHMKGMAARLVFLVVLIIITIIFFWAYS